MLENKSGYRIAFKESIPVGSKAVIIAMHGFCGDKESSCISALEEAVLKDDIGLIKFDWPGHGESEANGDQLTIDNCLSDIDSVVEYARDASPGAKIIAFATSFGGYLTLLYYCRNRDVFDYIILRSPAINMYRVLTNNILNHDTLSQIEQNGFINYGFERDLKVTKNFLEELKNNDINSLLENVDLPNVSIIHGTDDDLVPFEDSKVFAADHGCKLYPVEGADHRYKKPGELDKVIGIAMSIIRDQA